MLILKKKMYVFLYLSTKFVLVSHLRSALGWGQTSLPRNRTRLSREVVSDELVNDRFVRKLLHNASKSYVLLKT